MEKDPDRFHANLSPSFTMSWGHKFFVSQAPPLQGTVDGAGFLAHQAAMAPNLATWWIEVTKTCVDVEQRSAVLRGDFFMVAKGLEASQAVLNDIVFWVEMEEEENGKVVVNRAMEFVDPAASKELGRLMKAGTGGD